MKIIVFLGKMISDSHPMDLHEQPKYIKWKDDYNFDGN
jgi:hypothetical protein